MKNKQETKAEGEGLNLTIKHGRSWTKFEDGLKIPHQGTGVTKGEMLEALADLNLQNFSLGRDSFYPAQAEDAIKEKTGWRPEFGKLINTLNNFLQGWSMGELVKESDGEYRLLIFTASGPPKVKDGKTGNLYKTKPISFFSETKKNIDIFRKLAMKRGVNIETSRSFTEVLGYLRKLEIKLEKGKEKLDYKQFGIEAVLDKARKTSVGKKSDFFHKEPLWIDFDGNRVYERDEVREIIQDFKKGSQSCVLEGPPGSGKSVIAKNVGYKLSNEGWEVFIVEPRKAEISLEDALKEENRGIFEESRKDKLVIIDDAHLDFSNAYKAISILTNTATKYLVLTRYIGETHRDYNIIEKLKRKPIQAPPSADKVIEHFFKLEGYNPLEIEKAEWSLRDYKPDFWTLKYALRVYREKGYVDDESLIEYVVKDIKDVGGEDYFLVPSVFYRYELPVVEYFLTATLGLDKKNLDKLVDAGEILRNMEGKVSLHHSKQAELYYTAYMKNPYLGFACREKLKDTGSRFDEKELFHLYVQKYPEESLDVILSLELAWALAWALDRGSERKLMKLVDNLTKNNLESVKEGIEAEKDIKKIRSCFSWIARANEDVARGLLDVVVRKIKAEKDIKKIGEHVSWIARANEDIGKELASKLLDTLRRKIKAEKDIKDIGWCVFWIAHVNEDVARGLLDVVARKIEAEKDIKDIGWCVFWITYANEDIGKELVKMLDPGKAKTEEIKQCIKELKKKYLD